MKRLSIEERKIKRERLLLQKELKTSIWPTITDIPLTISINPMDLWQRFV